jgi:hypothetical protein
MTETEEAGAEAPKAGVEAPRTAPFDAQVIDNAGVKREGAKANGAVQGSCGLLRVPIGEAARALGRYVRAARRYPVIINWRGAARAAIVSIDRLAIYEWVMARYARDAAVSEMEAEMAALVEGRLGAARKHREASTFHANYAEKAKSAARCYGSLVPGGEAKTK